MSKKKKELKVYRLKASSPKAGVSAVALVDKPAIQLPYQLFSAAGAKEYRMEFKVTDTARQIISGPLVLANVPIYRSNPVYGEHYVVFTPEDVEAIAQKFFANGYQSNANEMHDDKRQLAGLVMYESFIYDSKRGIAPMAGYEDVPEGSWFGSFKVQSPEVWKQIQEGGFTGFSVEGFFDYADGPDNITAPPTVDSTEEEFISLMSALLTELSA